MTLLVALKLEKNLNIQPYQSIRVCERAALIGGTRAGLEKGDHIKLSDLYYGLMLPSGNDAALAIANFFGHDYFLREMNSHCKKIGLKNTSYGNPHGLGSNRSWSCAKDQALLSYYAIKNERIREIVETKNYSCEITSIHGTKKKMYWTNTNKLLCTEGWYGIKTGITKEAGFCLSSVVSLYDERTKKYCDLLLILLGCPTSEIRWQEAQTITNFALKQIEK